MSLADLSKDEPPIAIPREQRIVPPDLHNPKDTRAEPQAVSFPPANNPSFWVNRVFHFYQSYYAGNQYTDYARLTTDANLNFILELFSGQTYGGGPCERSVLNSLHGTLHLFTQPSLWLKFPATGDQRWVDTCNPSIDHDVPLSGPHSWFVDALDTAGLRFEFHNSNYAPYGWIKDFVFRRIK